MKKFILVLMLFLIAVTIIFSQAGSNENPYAGSYQYRGGRDMVLRLNKDDTFILFNAVGKNSDFVKGKYKVEDNNLTLIVNNNNLDKFITGTLSGKVEGSRIRIEAMQGYFTKY